MNAGRNPPSRSGGRHRQYFRIGLGASVGALLSTALIDAVYPLQFVEGLIIAVSAPGVLGLVAVTAGVQVYRRQSPRLGVGLIVGSLLATLLGILYGLTQVV